MDVLALLITIALLVTAPRWRALLGSDSKARSTVEERDAALERPRLLPAPVAEPEGNQQDGGRPAAPACAGAPVEQPTRELALTDARSCAPSTRDRRAARSVIAVSPPEARGDEEERRSRIRRIVEERGIRRLVHFTPVENIESILRHGLFSRAHLNERKIAHRFVDPKRRDQRLNYISLSITTPNFKMRFAKDRHMRDVEDWVILDINPSVLWELDCLFFPTNAASSRSRRRKDEELRTPEALERLFQGRRSPNLPPAFPSDPQAEVLVRDHVPPSYLTAVRVRNKCDPDPEQVGSLARRLKKAGLLGTVKIIYAPEDFEKSPYH